MNKKIHPKYRNFGDLLERRIKNTIPLHFSVRVSENYCLSFGSINDSKPYDKLLKRDNS